MTAPLQTIPSDIHPLKNPRSPNLQERNISSQKLSHPMKNLSLSSVFSCLQNSSCVTSKTSSPPSPCHFHYLQPPQTINERILARRQHPCLAPPGYSGDRGRQINSLSPNCFNKGMFVATD
ncbi:hypothetical protein CDAR_112541 [Caerostris darwini]|uniref:Uncharacterized protein n=1 Tax=Caerostris darwini TaxID=1538125 RepID=A0AAV4PXX1_9ARAC|nr:hypothetical protein CDAR_112541 [Caerostris darwini]